MVSALIRGVNCVFVVLKNFFTSPIDIVAQNLVYCMTKDREGGGLKRLKGVPEARLGGLLGFSKQEKKDEKDDYARGSCRMRGGDGR